MIKTDYFRILKSLDKSEISEWSIINGNFRKDLYQGDNFKSLVLDTGVDSSHKYLMDNVTGVNFLDNTGDYFDYNGHGTFCAGLICAKDSEGSILSVAPKSKCICAKILHGDARDSSTNYEKTICDAIEYGIQEEVDCISMSIGFPRKNKKIEEVINKATGSNIVCFAAAGNEGMVGSPYKSYPASYENVISVAASNSRGLPTWLSTSGIGHNKLEQPEFSISSKEFFYGLLPNNKYGKMIGTSMSTPVLAGAFLIWKESIFDGNIKTNSLLNDFRIWAINNSKNYNNSGWNKYMGYGSIKFP
jgi:major intracellular serine protease